MTSAKSSPKFFRMASTSPRHNGVAIRTFRIKAGKKPGEFASDARMSYQHLDNIENERKRASLEVLHRIAEALDIPIAAILRDPSAFTVVQDVPSAVNS